MHGSKLDGRKIRVRHFVPSDEHGARKKASQAEKEKLHQAKLEKKARKAAQDEEYKKAKELEGDKNDSTEVPEVAVRTMKKVKALKKRLCGLEKLKQKKNEMIKTDASYTLEKEQEEKLKTEEVILADLAKFERELAITMSVFAPADTEQGGKKGKKKKKKGKAKTKVNASKEEETKKRKKETPDDGAKAKIKKSKS
jgi:hypothetical protein